MASEDQPCLNLQQAGFDMPGEVGGLDKRLDAPQQVFKALQMVSSTGALQHALLWSLVPHALPFRPLCPPYSGLYSATPGHGLHWLRLLDCPVVGAVMVLVKAEDS